MPGVIQHFRKFDLKADRMVSTVAVCSDGSMIAIAAGRAIDLFEVSAVACCDNGTMTGDGKTRGLGSAHEIKYRTSRTGYQLVK